MAKEIKNISKGIERIERIVEFIKGGFQHYWNSFIENNLIILKGYYNNDEDWYSGPIGYRVEEVKLGWNNGREFYIQRIFTFGDYAEVEDLVEEDEDDFIKFGFILKGKPYVTHFEAIENVYWELLSRFLDIQEPNYNYYEGYDWYRFIPVRWLGAYNTGASVGKSRFEKALDYETNACQREKAAQAVISIGELKAICENNPYTEDGLKYSKVGILYSMGDCREVHYKDVWSRNIGQYLVSSDEYNTMDSYENHIVMPYEGTLLYMAMIGECFEEIEEAFDCRLDISLYRSGTNQEVFETLVEEVGYSYKEMKEFIKKFFNSSKVTRKAMAMTFKRELCQALDRREDPIHYYGMYYGNTAYHNECFIKTDSKPKAIVVRGRIKDSNYEIVKKIAKEKGLEILHF